MRDTEKNQGMAKVEGVRERRGCSWKTEVRHRKPAGAVEVLGLFAASRVPVGLVLPSSCIPKASSGLGFCRAGKTYIHGLRCLEGSLANAQGDSDRWVPEPASQVLPFKGPGSPPPTENKTLPTASRISQTMHVVPALSSGLISLKLLRAPPSRDE